MNDFSPDKFEQKDLPFRVNRLSPTIGGEILGVDLKVMVVFCLTDFLSMLRKYVNKNKS